MQRLLLALGPRRVLKWVLVGVGAVLVLMLVVLPLLLSVVAGSSASEDPAYAAGGGVCAPIGAPPGFESPQWDEEQVQMASVIVTQAVVAGVSPQGATVALATAMQESGLRNIDYGDRDSLGLFQQRPSTGWGTPEQIRTPALSADAFFGVAQHTANPGLVDIVGWESMALTVAAQAVQASAFPDAYAKWEPAARELVNGLYPAAGTQPSIPGGPGSSVDPASLCTPAQGMDCPVSPYPDVEEGLTPDAVSVLRCTAQTFPKISTFYGVGDRPDNPNSDHPTGRAVDLSLYSPAFPDGYRSPQAQAYGWEISNWLRTNHASLGVKYVIFSGWRWEPGLTDWEPYTHPSGLDDDTRAHVDHVHVSVHGNRSVGTPGDPGEPGDPGGWAHPLPAGSFTISSGFGERVHPVTGRVSLHGGLDFSAPTGTPISSVCTGEVSHTRFGATAGLATHVQCADGTETRYLHQSAFQVQEGDQVAAGDVIGLVGNTGGSTGPHLHLETRTAGSPMDPVPFMMQRGVDLTGGGG